MTYHLDPRQTLRRQLRQARRSLSADEQRNAAQALVMRTTKHFLDQQAQPPNKVALYLSNDGEISPHLLCEYFWQQDIAIYLPVIKDKQLVFARYVPETEWQSNAYGIQEPTTTEHIAGADLDIVFLPLVGFDSNGGRLGMGGGFYDRTFANKKVDKAPQLIGLAHDCQEVKNLPIEGWDVPLQAIITPKQVVLVS